MLQFFSLILSLLLFLFNIHPQESPTAPSFIETQPAHSELYLPDVPVEDVVNYFNEVCLAAEFSDNGNPSLLQRWETPILYTLRGAPTEEDIAVLESFAQKLNTLEGFPGIRECSPNEVCNLNIHFVVQEELESIMGENSIGADGSVTFWYMEDVIYEAIICIRSDVDQHLRNSVILEEIYNGLGPVQDTLLRPDSLIYAEYSEPQAMTDVDELLLRLLYHPKMKCGMDFEQCCLVIEELYY